MKLVTKPVDLSRDKQTLLELLQRNLTDLDHAKRFQWLYHDNPAGEAWAWFIIDEHTSCAVGAATVYPKFFWIDGTEKRCGQVADFAVDAAYRSLGPAVRLQRATFEPVDEGELEFCYDCPPNDRGMATFKRLGLSPLCRMTRFTRIERVDALARRLPGGELVRTPVTVLGNAALSLRRLVRGRDTEMAVSHHEAMFGDEFDRLERRLVDSRPGVRARRLAHDLNWRYRLDPLNEYVVLIARRADELAGFVVIAETKSAVNLVDLVAVSESARRALLDAVSDEACARGKVSINMYLVDGSTSATLARRAGFVPRELGDRVVVYPQRALEGGGSPTSDSFSLGYADTIA